MRGASPPSAISRTSGSRAAACAGSSAAAPEAAADAAAALATAAAGFLAATTTAGAAAALGAVASALAPSDGGGSEGLRRSAIITLSTRPLRSTPWHRCTASSAELRSRKVTKAQPRELPVGWKREILILRTL